MLVVFSEKISRNRVLHKRIIVMHMVRNLEEGKRRLKKICIFNKTKSVVVLVCRVV